MFIITAAMSFGGAPFGGAPFGGGVANAQTFLLGGVSRGAVADSAAAVEARLRASIPDSTAAFWARTKVDSTKVDANSLSVTDINNTGIDKFLMERLLLPFRFLLPAEVDTTVAGEAGNNVEVSTDVFATVHPDSGIVLRFSPEDAAAAPDTISAVVFDQVFAPGDSLIFYADADTAGQKVTVTITGADETVILNQTATSADDQGYVRYAFPVAATVTQQEYRVVYRFIGYFSHWMKMSRVTMKKAG
jgi:hypothetical protein